MTYNVFSGTLNPTQSINLGNERVIVIGIDYENFTVI